MYSTTLNASTVNRFDPTTVPVEATPFEAAAGNAILREMEDRHWWEGFNSYPAGEGLWSHWHDAGYQAAAELAAQRAAEAEELANYQPVLA